jgi:hypothetical protein
VHTAPIGDAKMAKRKCSKQEAEDIYSKKLSEGWSPRGGHGIHCWAGNELWGYTLMNPRSGKVMGFDYTKTRTGEICVYIW